MTRDVKGDLREFEMDGELFGVEETVASCYGTSLTRYHFLIFNEDKEWTKIGEITFNELSDKVDHELDDSFDEAVEFFMNQKAEKYT